MLEKMTETVEQAADQVVRLVVWWRCSMLGAPSPMQAGQGWGSCTRLRHLPPMTTRQGREAAVHTIHTYQQWQHLWLSAKPVSHDITLLRGQSEMHFIS